MTTIKHHPSEETLTAFVGSALCEANSFVVAAHLMHCAACRDAAHDMEMIAGELLEHAEPSSIASTTRADCMSRLDTPSLGQEPPDIVASPTGNALLGPLELYDHGDWQWLGPGIQKQTIDVPSESGTRVFLLKAAPGTRLPDHKHVGSEWTCVLQGAFTHDGGRFGPGDFDEADSEFDHNPQVEHGVECVCLVAMNGEIKMKSLMGRMLQPLVKF